MASPKNHERVNDILLGPLERPALNWLATHLPSWITPDGCTIIGILGSVIIAVGFVLSRIDRNFLWLAILGFLINWFGDSLDGTLARFRHIERPIYGFFVDHTSDLFSQLLIFLSLGASPYIGFNFACLLLIAYLLLSIMVYIRTSLFGEFKISYSKLGPTEFRVFAIMLTIAMYFGGLRYFNVNLWDQFKFGITPYDFVVIFFTLLLLYFFSFTAVKEIVRLRKLNE
jgi:phosphatidylglycerophosphate synthase